MIIMGCDRIVSFECVCLYTYKLFLSTTVLLPYMVDILASVGTKVQQQLVMLTFEFIHNIRRNANRRKKMFESILIGS
jgi:hypothetical protein